MTAEGRRALEQATHEHQGNPSLVITPALKTFFNSALHQLVQNQLQRNIHAINHENFLRITLVITEADDLSRVAKRFSGRQPPDFLLSHLKELRNREPAGEICVPLETLLGGFLESHANRFECTGANCIRSSLSVAHREAMPNLVGTKELTGAIDQSHELFTGPLETGNLLVYCDTQGKVVHAVNYIGQNRGRKIIFTKNGYFGLIAHGFQYQDAVDEQYKVFRNQRVLSYRQLCGAQILQAAAS